MSNHSPSLQPPLRASTVAHASLGVAKHPFLQTQRSSCDRKRLFYDRCTGELRCFDCGGWPCATCARRKVALRRQRIERMMSAARARGWRSYSGNFTASGASRADLQRCWNRLLPSIKRRHPDLAYVTAVEWNADKGGFHLHWVIVVRRPLTRELRALALRAGFGWNTYARKIIDSPRDYRRVAAYLVKQTVAMGARGVRRPVNFSQSAAALIEDPPKPKRTPGRWRYIPASPANPAQIALAVARVLKAERREQLRRALEFFDRLMSKQQEEVIPHAV